MGMWEFFNQHYFLAWFALWLVWGVFWIIAIATECVLKLVNRILRTIKVCARGWPPEHLDADGDWKPEQKPEQ